MRNKLEFDNRLLGIELLQPYLEENYLPFTNGTLRPINIITIFNEIFLNVRKNIIEFGSGTSSILLARMIKINKLTCFIHSIDHNKEWLDKINQLIESENLSGVIKTVYAPLTTFKDNAYWYNREILDDFTTNVKYDCVIVDGPPAFKKEIERSRYPAVEFIMNKLDKEYSFFLDDANRSGEQWVIQEWQRLYNIEFNMISASMAYYTNRGTFHPGVL